MRTPDRATVYAVAAVAVADHRTVSRVLRGQRVRGDADARIRRALAERGITLPQPNPEKG
jgi:DNA-binding LacI/PurR family transcriptional regulator